MPLQKFVDRLPFFSARTKKRFLRWVIIHRGELIHAAVVLLVAFIVAFIAAHRPF
jgi:hypothetical protein